MFINLFNSHLIGTSNSQETANSDVVIITSGLGRKLGMTRDELLLAKKSTNCLSASSSEKSYVER